MQANHTTTKLLLAVLLAAAVVCALVPVAAAAAEDGERSAWSAYLDPVADVWATRMGYNMRGREQAGPAAEFDEDEDDDSRVGVHANLKRNQENGGGSCSVNETNVCNGKGNCTNDVCVCRNGWTGPTCHHERKEKLTAFLLEFFIGAPTGASSFYLGYIGQGVGKILMYWVACLLLCFGNVAAGFSKACCGTAGMVVSYLVVNLIASASLIGVSIWCLVDWIMILTDDLNDYDGYYLEGF